MNLNNQISDWDSAPTCLFNCLKLLYKRDEIPLKLIKIIYNNTLDQNEYFFNNGTSRFAMKRICNKFNIYGIKHNIDIHFMYYAKNEVTLDIIKKCLNENKILIIRNNYGNENSFMAFNIDNDKVYIYDPSKENKKNIYNIIIKLKDLDTTKNTEYSLGPIDTRELIVASKYC